MAGAAISRIDVEAYRVPLERPVATSFGIMTSRPAVFVRLEAADGAFGWGEIFANWPAAGAEHRARLLVEDVAELVLGSDLAPGALYRHLDAATSIRALQCGEWGPFRQVIAGLDTAHHDLAARRAGVPLARALAPGAALEVPAYASGIDVRAAAPAIEAARGQGFAAFKVKVGFDLDRDIAAVGEVASGLREGERLFTDANQGFGVEETLRFCAGTGDAGLGWLEEPIRADAPGADWRRIADTVAVPLAGGENLAPESAFEAAIGEGVLSVIQPDVAKWGGVTGCLAVARQALDAGRMYCPHFLGGGIGLAASAHLLAAAGGPGLLEFDVNPNPLREAFLGGVGRIEGGAMVLPDRPGLGVEALPEELAPYRTLALTRRAG